LDGGGRIVFALRSREDLGAALAGASSGRRLSAGALPRFLRRPVRILARLTSGETAMPRYAASMATAALFAATALYGMAVGGHYPAVVQMLTAHSGFAVSDVRVSGNGQVSDIDVLQALGLDGWTSLVGLDADAVREQVVALPWVESAAVRKVYPGTLEVAIAEKAPFAIWQHGDDLVVIESSGAPIAPFRNAGFADLPLVVGEGAAARAQAIVTKVAAHPALAAQVQGYVRVADRRWDLNLADGVTVKLPEAGEAGALDYLMALDAADGLLSRDVLAIDLRLDDRVVVQLTPGALERREAEMKQRLKASTGRRT
jgi:cell division protein FtsQ